ncbi:unnamed protein product [Phaedon cochleariae]|uniref:Uncharacterized protein n=1 Tax=Phaedon cochleariae TaxID=80249 RepID=A0A9N9X5C3_PHACE|nr:unnamed protein product [Phaedon cochleariae]
MGDGDYYHFGLRSSVMETLHKYPPKSDCTILNLQINVDGLPISKSSTSQFWPILGNIEECSRDYVFPIGVYHGKSKPSSCTESLKRFVEDFQEISENGLLFQNEMKILKLAKVLCGAPAKSFLLGVKSHNASFGCTKCTT